MKQQTALLISIPLGVGAAVFFVMGLLQIRDYNAVAASPKTYPKTKISDEDAAILAGMENNVAKAKQSSVLGIVITFTFSFACAASLLVIWIPFRRRCRRRRKIARGTSSDDFPIYRSD